MLVSFTSNLIRAEFKFNYFFAIFFIVAMEISIFLAIHYIKLQCNSSRWCKFHLDLSPESLLNGQLKMLGMVQKKTVLRKVNLTPGNFSPQTFECVPLLTKALRA